MFPFIMFQNRGHNFPAENTTDYDWLWLLEEKLIENKQNTVDLLYQRLLKFLMKYNRQDKSPYIKFYYSHRVTLKHNQHMQRDKVLCRRPFASKQFSFW